MEKPTITLEKMLDIRKSHQDGVRLLPEGEAFKIIKPIAVGLKELHLQGLVIGDLNPSSILLY